MSASLTFDQIVRGLVDRYGVPYEKAMAAAHRIAQTTPITRRRGPRPQRERKTDIQAIGFRILCREAGLPLPTVEHCFAMHLTPKRRWRFDFAFVEERVAVEVEGGIHSGGRHVRGKGYAADMEKYTHANLMGWKLIRVTPQQLCTDATIELVRAALSPPSRQSSSSEPSTSDSDTHHGPE